MKKLLSLALVLCMLLGVGATALAEDVPTFTVACNRWTEVWGTDFTQTAFLKEIGEKTGVNIEWRLLWFHLSDRRGHRAQPGLLCGTDRPDSPVHAQPDRDL